MSRIVFILWMCVVGLIPWGMVQGDPPSIQKSSNTPSVERGMTGTWTFTHSGKPLIAKPQRDPDPPLSIRLHRSKEQGGQYEVRFIGTREGFFDLRDYLEHGDGTEAKDLPAMMIRVISTLPKDQRSDLFDSNLFRPKIFGGYRFFLALIALGWLAIPILYWMAKGGKVPDEIVQHQQEQTPSIVEQLQPILRAAGQRSLTTDEQGRLELLLIHFWREKGTSTGQSMAETIQNLRAHAEAGPLIQSIESWLHRQTIAGSPNRSLAEIVELLKPIGQLTERIPTDGTGTSESHPIGLGDSR